MGTFLRSSALGANSWTETGGVCQSNIVCHIHLQPTRLPVLQELLHPGPQGAGLRHVAQEQEAQLQHSKGEK